MIFECLIRIPKCLLIVKKQINFEIKFRLEISNIETLLVLLSKSQQK